MAKSAPAPKEIYLVLVETESDKPITDEHKYLISKLVADKIFSETEDDICITRFGSTRTDFNPPSWELLRKFNNEFSDKAKPMNGRAQDVITVLSGACELVNLRADEDTYCGKKVLFFGQFKTEMNKKKVQDLVKLAETSEIILTLVFPKREELNEIQKKNFSILKEATEKSESAFVSDFEEGLAKLVNKIAIKGKRNIAYKFELKIGSYITIPVKKLIVNRKASLTFDKYKKEQVIASRPVASQRNAGTSGESIEQSQGSIASHTGGSVVRTVSGTNVASFSETKRLDIEKEVLWKSSKGDHIDDTQLQYGYKYGGELVPEEDSSMVTEPTEQNLKVLVFCPRENIPPAYLTGEGTDIYFPQDNNEEARANFHALLNALAETKCVAIVRYVTRKNSPVNMYVLVPDLERMGLIASEVCYADDVGIPTFPPLVQENASNRSTQAQDSLMDQLIEASTIADFNPENGPMNPQTVVFRDKIISKIVYGKEEYSVHKKYNTIDLLFDKHEIPEDLIQKLKEEFPLILKKNTADTRPAGRQVFRKRQHAGDDLSEDEKKIKMSLDTEELLLIQEPVVDEDVDALERTRYLYALDFDHTIVNENSDSAITEIITQPIPDNLKNFYDGTNWTEFMDYIFRFVASEGGTIEALKGRIEALELTPGMDNLLEKINGHIKKNKPQSHLIIVSDANDFFISTRLLCMHPPVIPNLILSNHATYSADKSYLKIYPYEDQTLCDLCPRNMCKGNALSKYIVEHGPFTQVYYCGDGANDLCPGMRLTENDILFVRQGFTLERILSRGSFRGRGVNIAAAIIYFEDAKTIQEHIKF